MDSFHGQVTSIDMSHNRPTRIMIIPEYLNEVQHAVAVVMGEIYREQHEAERLRQELLGLQAATNVSG